MPAESEVLFERLLDLTNQIRLEKDPNRMITLTTDLNRVLVEILDFQARERLRKALTKAAKPNS